MTRYGIEKAEGDEDINEAAGLRGRLGAGEKERPPCLKEMFSVG